MVVPEGVDATKVKSPVSKKCCMCRKSVSEFISCEKCGSRNVYCSKDCLDMHEDHSRYCPLIVGVMEVEHSKREGRNSRVTLDNERLSYKMKRNLINLVGERPLVNVYLNGVDIRGLWDTGAMVSIINYDVLKEKFPEVELRPVSEVSDGNLNVLVANQSKMNVAGIAILNFGVEKYQNLFQIPFLVTSDSITDTILGYNAIEHFIVHCKNDLNVPGSLPQMIKSLTKESADKIISLVEIGERVEPRSVDVIVEKDKVVSRGSMSKIRCKIKDLGYANVSNKSIIFSPATENSLIDEIMIFESTEKLNRRKKSLDIWVYNPSASDVTLRKGTLMGEVSEATATFQLPENWGPVEAYVNGVNVTEGDENVEEEIKIDLEHLDNEKREKVLGMLKEEEEVFAKSKNDIGHIKDFKLKIHLKDEIPVYEPYRKIPKMLYDEVKSHVEDLILNGWVTESFSPYASPMVCARKKGGGLRLCMDYRKLNAKTVQDRQPIPRITDILDNLKGNKWFTTLDCAQAYHQGEMSEESRKYTAFSTPWNLYEWVRIPYGITGAGPGYQRYMNNTLKDFKDRCCAAYLDDVLIFSNSFSQHLKDVQDVLGCLKKKGMKLNPGKCEFFKKELRYLGRLISENGYRPDPEDVVALEKCREIPKTVGELRSILGFLGYYRTYLKDFSKRLQPVYELLQGGSKKEKKNVDAKRKIVVTPEMHGVINEMVEELKSPNVIAFPDFNLPFIVHCDASQKGLGACLYQMQEGKLRIISLASRTLTPAEKNYFMHSGKLEFLALKWAVTEKFQDYLLNGPKFEVVTDNNPLTYVLTTAKLNTTGLRWIAELADYDFSIRYRKGIKHVDADFLSRNPVEVFENLQENANKVVSGEDVKMVFAQSSKPEKIEMSHWIKIEGVDVGISPGSKKISRLELIEAQKEDKIVGPVYEILEKKSKIDPELRKKKQENWITVEANGKTEVGKGCFGQKNC